MVVAGQSYKRADGRIYHVHTIMDNGDVVLVTKSEKEPVQAYPIQVVEEWVGRGALELYDMDSLINEILKRTRE